MKLSFCLEMLYPELSFIDRLNEAKKDGITYFEFWDWRDKDLSALKQRMDQLGMKVCNFSGNRNYGMIDPTERDSFLAEVRETGAVAKQLGCPALMLLVQSLEKDNSGRLPSIKMSDQEVEKNIIECGQEVGKIGDELDLDIVIEPLNDVLDHPNYVLTSASKAFQIIRAIGHPRVKVLFDIYHIAMQGEDVFKHIENNFDGIGYFHVADKPGRNEPGSGTIDYVKIYELLKRLGNEKVVGFEYMPSTNDSTAAVKKTLEIFSD